MSLPDPYGSAPRNPGRFVLYISRHGDDDTQSMVQVFAQPYAARKFLDELLADDGVVWDDECTIRSETGVVVSTRWYPDRMREAHSHEYTLEEMAWTLDHLHAAAARRFRCGPELPRTAAEAATDRPRRSQSSAPSAPRASREGLVPVGDIALALGVDARNCRAALRKLGIEKPAVGWAWPADQVEAVKARIQGAL